MPICDPQPKKIINNINTSRSLATVLNNGNNAGSKSINMNDNDITNINELQAVGNGSTNTITSQQMVIQTSDTLQSAAIELSGNGADMYVEDVSGNYVNIATTTSYLPYNGPTIEINDATNEKVLFLTPQKLYLGTPTNFNSPANKLLGTDSNGNLYYKNQNVENGSVGTLEDVLEEGNTAGQSIDMSNNNITNIGELQFSAVPVSTPVLNQTGTSLKIQMNGQDYYIQVFTVS
jgi:hypothetical protein